MRKIKDLGNFDKITLLSITIVSIILCSNFLQMHYSSDTVCLIKWGHFEYPSHYFLQDGRIISTLVCYLGGLLHLPYNVYIIGMDIIGVILLSLTVWILYKSILKIIQPQDLIKKIILLLGTYVLIFNQFTLEFLLFPESAVMCFGVFTSILAATKVITDEKHKYLKITGLLFIAAFSYQGLINIFPVVSILLFILKQEKETQKLENKEEIKALRKKNIKKLFIELIKMAIILLIVVIINLVVMKIGITKIGKSSERIVDLSTAEAIKKRFNDVKIYLDEIWNKSMNMLPIHLNSICVFITSVLILVYKKKVKYEIFIKYIALIALILVMCILPIFVFNTGICGRVNVPIAEIWGVSLILILLLTEEQENNEKKIYRYKNHFIYTIVSISFILNAMMIFQNTSEHIASNRVDEALGKTIKYAIEAYEKENGVEIKKFGYAYDKNPQQYSENIKHIGSLTERKFACPWCLHEAMEFYCERKFEKAKMPLNVFNSYKKEDYVEFSEEQLYFQNDTIYLLVY